MRIRIIAASLAVGAVLIAAITGHYFRTKVQEQQSLPPVEWIILKPGDPIPKDLRQKPKKLPDEWFQPRPCVEIEMITQSGCKRPFWT